MSRREAADRFHAHMRGWRDGASMRARRREFSEHKTRPDIVAAYETGYQEGIAAERTQSRLVSKLYDYRSSILRWL